MMRYTATAMAWILAATLATAAQAQSFVGRWTATAHLQGDIKTSETLDVTKVDAGYAVTGKAIDAPPGSPTASPGMDVVLDGNRFSYKRTLNVEGNGIEIFYTGTVSGDTFTGTAELGGMEIPYTGVRIPAGK